MKLSHQVDLPLAGPEVWALLDDPQRLASAMPGARLDGVDGDHLKGSVNVRLGPMNLTYEGTAIIEERDQSAGIIRLAVAGREQRGAGTASADVLLRMAPEGNTTTVTVDTELTLTGRPAQLGVGMVQGVAQKIFTEFAERLARESKAPVPDHPGEEAGDALDLTRPALYLVATILGLILLVAILLSWIR